MLFLFAGGVGLIAYVFAGYPAIAAALARLRPRPVRADAGFRPDVSLIVVAYNERDVIARKLANCAALDYPDDRLELVVITDGSDDGTDEVARAVPGVRVLHQPQRAGKLAAMNRAAQFARGDVLVFSDANNLYTPAALRELVAPFADASVGIATGRKAIDDGSGRPLDVAEGLYWRYESKLKEWEGATGSVTAVAGEILAFRRSAFRSPAAGTMNEDFVQAMLVAADGWRVAYVPQALSLEPASATIADEAVRRSRLVTGRWQALRALLPALLRRNPRLFWQVVSHKGLRPLVPAALVAVAVSNAALARRRRWARGVAGAQLGFYALAVLGGRRERHGKRSRLLYVPYWFCRMNLATLAGFRDYVAGSRQAVWAKVARYDGARHDDSARPFASSHLSTSTSRPPVSRGAT
jgi:cellulose synthase/poly-beta-1,6-N-acetylglucosamine synthase-like glycosyltransferase